MSDTATIARANASHCEAKKHAYRQTQDGVVVSFVLHPQEVPAALTLAPLGTRYVLALVEVDDNETPKQRREAPATQPTPDPALRSPTTAGGAHKKGWDEYSYAQQAGMLCSDVSFRRFLAQPFEHIAVLDLDMAEDEVRDRCGVDSRTKILPGTDAALHWEKLVRDYRAWMHEPEHVG